MNLKGELIKSKPETKSKSRIRENSFSSLSGCETSYQPNPSAGSKLNLCRNRNCFCFWIYVLTRRLRLRYQPKDRKWGEFYDRRRIRNLNIKCPVWENVGLSERLRWFGFDLLEPALLFQLPLPEKKENSESSQRTFCCLGRKGSWCWMLGSKLPMFLQNQLIGLCWTGKDGSLLRFKNQFSVNNLLESTIKWETDAEKRVSVTGRPNQSKDN